MGMIRLRVREFAAQKGWTIKEVSDRSGVDIKHDLNADYVTNRSL